ncbi:MAG: acetate--CoA ligase family protein [Burkholderiales bacterium]|nr:acetate--CoA ligase family protein [Burkholderiales bacterium]
MLMMEYAGKRLLRQYGVPVPAGALLRKSADARRWRGSYPVALKAQVPSGGRGKAGGVLRADRAEQAESAAQRLFDLEFGGMRAAALLMEPWIEHSRELYLAVTVDGESGGYVVLYGPSGGIDVEHHTPCKYAFGTPRDFRAHELRSRLASVEPGRATGERVVALARRLVFAATALDALTVEINPLALLPDGRLLALDAKIVRDDAAAFRHADIAEELARSRKHEPRLVRKALAGNLMMVGLDGEVGLISGGAGMTMAGMDMIAASGLKPACFLDCSSNPTPAGYRLAFDVLDAEPKVKAILVSIFGGGTQIDRVARVMDEIMRKRVSRKPVIFRMNGTGRERADALMREAGLHNHPTLESAVDAVAASVRAR